MTRIMRKSLTSSVKYNLSISKNINCIGGCKMFNDELLRKAESGDVESALEVANCYYRGIDVEEDNC